MQEFQVRTSTVIFKNPLMIPKLFLSDSSEVADELMLLILDYVGKDIYENVRENEQFVVKLVNDESSKNILMQRLPDETVYSDREGNPINDYGRMYAFRIQIVNSKVIWDLPQYKYSNHNSESSIRSNISGSIDAIKNFKSSIRNFIDGAKQKIDELNPIKQLDKQLDEI